MSEHFILLNHERCVIELSQPATSDFNPRPTAKADLQNLCVKTSYTVEQQGFYLRLFKEIQRVSQNPEISELCMALSQPLIYDTLKTITVPTIYDEKLTADYIDEDIFSRYSKHIITQDAVYLFQALEPERYQTIGSWQSQIKKLKRLINQDPDIPSQFDYSKFQTEKINTVRGIVSRLTLCYTREEELSYWVQLIQDQPDYFLQCPKLQALSLLEKNLLHFINDPKPIQETAECFLLAEYEDLNESLTLFSVSEPTGKNKLPIFYCSSAQEATSFFSLNEASRQSEEIYRALHRDAFILRYEGGTLKEFLLPQSDSFLRRLPNAPQLIEKFNKSLERVYLQHHLGNSASLMTEKSKPKFKL